MWSLRSTAPSRNFITSPVRCLVVGLTLTEIFAVGAQMSTPAPASGSHAWAASSVAAADSNRGGDRERGRSIFNGIGGCFNCHGHDGDLTRRPHFSPKLADELARLSPQPADLRHPASLKSENDEQRFLSIKFGHSGTAMFPKKFLTDQEINHILAYLATLRVEAADQDKAGQ